MKRRTDLRKWSKDGTQRRCNICAEFFDLKHLNVNFKGVNVLEDENLRQGIKDFSDWPTIPQLYIKSEFIGGCDIIKEMFEKGELKKILVEKKII